MSIKINPSIAAGDILNLRDQLKVLEEAKADRIHFDVMDGHFVPELTIGLPFLRQVKKATQIPLDVHIMITNPDSTFELYLDAGADTLVFHPEVAQQAHRICQVIREKGKKAGVALCPATPWREIEPLIPFLDHITVMTVSPGFSRQSHLTEMHPKIKELVSFTKMVQWKGVIEVDGGVSEKNIELLAEIGADYFVSGGNIFDAKEGIKAKIQQLRTLAESGVKKRKH